jgi:hypothetical protein
MRQSHEESHAPGTAKEMLDGPFQWAAAAAACSLSHLGEHSISMASILAARTRSGRESLLEFGLGCA